MERNTTGEAHARNHTSPLIQLPAGMAVFLFVLNSFLSVSACLGNALILIALHNVSSLHPPTKLLFQSLAATDLCVGLITQPLAVIAIYLPYITEINRNVSFYLATVNFASNSVFLVVSILTSTAISVDRLLALILGLRYRHVVTTWRVRAVIIGVWFSGVSNGLIYNFLDYHIALIIAAVVVILSVLISIFCYANIALRLRRHHAQVQGHSPNQTQSNGEGILLNIARYKKTVSSIAWVQLAIFVCYIPFGIIVIVRVHIERVSETRVMIWFSAITLMYLNSSLNPFLYCWKIRDMRQATKATIIQLCCLSG